MGFDARRSLRHCAYITFLGRPWTSTIIRTGLDDREYLAGRERMELIFNLDAVRPVDELYDSYEFHE